MPRKELLTMAISTTRASASARFLGRLGGYARAAKMTRRERSISARRAIRARWAKWRKRRRRT